MPMIRSNASRSLAFLLLLAWPLEAQVTNSPPAPTEEESPKRVKQPSAQWDWEASLPGYREKLQPLVEAWANGAWDELEAVATNPNEPPLVRLFAVHPLFDRELDHNNLVWDRPKQRQYRFHKLISDIAPTVIGPERTWLMRVYVSSKDHSKRISGSNIWAFIDSHILKQDGNPALFNWLWKLKPKTDEPRYEDPTPLYLSHPVVILNNWSYFSEVVDTYNGATRIDRAAYKIVGNPSIKEMKKLLSEYAKVFKGHPKKLKSVRIAINRVIKQWREEENMKDMNL